jgi:hypothetical protein
MQVDFLSACKLNPTARMQIVAMATGFPLSTAGSLSAFSTCNQGGANGDNLLAYRPNVSDSSPVLGSSDSGNRDMGTLQEHRGLARRPLRSLIA